MGLRAEIEQDLAEFLEDPSEFGMAVILISPDGVTYDTSENDGETLYGQVLFDTVSQDEDGNQIIVHKPVVTLRRSSLARLPAAGEKWVVKIPESVLAGADTETYIVERASEDGKSLGLIRLYLRAVEQSS